MRDFYNLVSMVYFGNTTTNQLPFKFRFFFDWLFRLYKDPVYPVIKQTVFQWKVSGRVFFLGSPDMAPRCLRKALDGPRMLDGGWGTWENNIGWLQDGELHIDYRVIFEPIGS